MNNPIVPWAKKPRDSKRSRILYGRSASALLLWYLLAMVGVLAGTFVLFLLGYNFYKLLQNHFTHYYYDFITPFLVTPLYNLMLGVRDMALLVVILVVAAGWLGVTWAFFRLYQRDITKVVQAAGTLMDPDAAPPQLPDALAPAEAALRIARQQVQHNADLAGVDVPQSAVFRRGAPREEMAAAADKLG